MAGDIVWTQSTLGDIVEEWIVGSTPPRTDTKCFIREGGTPWVRAEDVKNGTLYETAEQISEAGGRRMQLVPANAVLVTTAGTIGRVAVTFCAAGGRCCSSWPTAQRSPTCPREN